MDTYQPIYDAVRSRISGFDGEALIERIAYNFDISQHTQILQQEFITVAYEMQRPSAIYKPNLSIDGDQWCALYGVDLMNGVAGFGDSPAKAMDNFDKEWNKTLVKSNV